MASSLPPAVVLPELKHQHRDLFSSQTDADVLALLWQDAWQDARLDAWQEVWPLVWT